MFHSLRRTFVLSWLSALLISPVATSSAQTLYWDVDGPNPGAGGAQPGEIWNLASSFWNNAAGDAAPVVWDNSGLATAVFAAGTDATGSFGVTLGASGTLLLSGLTLNAGSLTLAQQTLADGLDFGAVAAALNVAAGSGLTIQAPVAGSGGLVKSGAGSAWLAGLQAPGGSYSVQAGELKLGDGLTVNAGGLTLGGSAGQAALLTLGSGTVFNLGGGLTFSNVGTPLSAVVQGGLLNLNGSRTFTVQNIASESDLSITSVIGDGSLSSGLIKAGAGTLVLSGENTYTGTTTVNAASGSLWIQGNQAGIAGSSGLAVGAACSVVIGSSADTATVNRLGDSASVRLNGGASGGAGLSYVGSDFAEAAVHHETAGALVFAGDHRSTLTLTPGAGDEVSLSLASLAREDHALGLVRGAALGAAAGTADSSHLTFVAEPTLVSGIIPWLIGDVSSTGTGTTLVTYTPGLGLRLLSAGDYSSSVAAGGHFLKSTAGALAINASSVIASWTGSSTGTTTLGAGVTLGVQSGAMLFSSTGGISGGTLDLAGSQEGVIHLAAGVAVTATLNSVITGSRGLTLSGSGAGNKILVLGGANTFTGDVRVYGGILQLNNAAALNAGGVNSLALQSGGSLRLNGQSITIQELNGAGALVNNHATVNSSLTVSAGSFSGTINNGAAATNSLIKKGSGTLTLQGNNAYTGSTVVEGGTVQLGNGGNGGRLSGTTSIQLKAGSRLLLTNTNGNNVLTDRVNNAAGLLLQGATLEFNNSAASGTDYAETVGVVTLGAGANQITADQAAAGRASELILSGLLRQTGGSVNFTGGASGLGTSTRNCLDITGAAAGFLGGWATVGNEFARYVTDIDAALAGDQGSVTAFTSADYSSAVQADWNGALHVKPAADQTLNAAREVASMNLTTGIDINLGGSLLTVQSGGLIKQGGAVGNNGAANRSQITNGSLTAGNTAGAELFLRVTGANLNISAAIADNGAGSVHVVKGGAGLLNLSGANSYSGTTYVNAGTLIAGSSTATGSGSVVVAASARLGGNGIAGSTASGASFILETGGTVFAGQSGLIDAQVLTLKADASFTLRGTLELDIIGGTASGGLNAQTGSHDRVIFTSSSGNGLGAPVLSGSILRLNTNVAVSPGGWTEGSSFRLFDWSGLTGTFANLPSEGLQTGNPLELPDLSSLGLGWDWSQLYSGGLISVTAIVPEPGRVMLLAAGLLGLLLRRRRPTAL